MNGLHNLVVAGKVLYLVSKCSEARYYCRIVKCLLGLSYEGRIGYAGVGRVPGKPVRQGPRKDTFRHLSRSVECYEALI